MRNETGTSALAALGLLFTMAANAQPAAPESSLQTITITGSRSPKALSDLPSSVTIVENENLREQLDTSTNILGALDMLVPGLTVSQGEFRSACRTNIRGRPAQFLINGVPTNDNLRRSSCGSLFGISPFAIEQVEVLRGSTALFGAGAPGGVINLITRRAKSDKLEVDAAAQWSFNRHERSGSDEYNLYAGAGQRLAGWDYYVGGSFQRYGVRHNPDGGIVPGTEFRANSLNASAGAQFGPGNMRFTGSFNEEDPRRTWTTDATQVSGERFADTVLVADPPNPFQHQAKTTQRVLSLSYELPSVLGHKVSLAAFNHDEKLVQRSADFFQGDVFYFDTDAENQRLGLRSTASRTYVLGTGELETAFGVDWLRQRYYRPQVDPASGRVIGYISPEVKLQSTALFFQPQFRTGPWLLTGGVRHERFRGEVGSEGFNPSIRNSSTPGDIPGFSLTLFNAGAVYDISNKLQAFASFSQGAEISEFGRAARGAKNPSLINLDGAKSDQVEVGLRGRAGSVDFTAAAFHSRSDKAANLRADPACAGQPLCPLIPLRRAQKIQGVEATADWRLNPSWLLGAVATYQKGKFTEPGATPVPFGTDTLPPPRVVLHGEYRPAPQWKLRLQGAYSASTDEYDAAQQAAGFRNTDSVFLVDFAASYQWGPGRMTLGVSNLFNKKYVNVTNQASGDFFYYLSEGRRVSLTYEARF